MPRRHVGGALRVTPVVTVTDAPAVIERGLNRDNSEKAGYWDSRPMAVLVSNEGGRRRI